MQTSVLETKRVKFATPIVTIALIIILSDLLLGFAAIMYGYLFVPAVIISILTCTILVVGHLMYSNLKTSCEDCSKAACEQCKEKIKALKQIFSKTNISLSIADIFVAGLALLFSSTIVGENVISFAIGINMFKAIKVAINGTSARIQLQKLRQFYIINRRLKTIRRNKMKAFFKWLFVSNPKTHAAILFIVGSVALALISVLTNAIPTNGIWQHLQPALIGGLGILGAAIAAWAGLEKNTTADARKRVEEATAEQEKKEYEAKVNKKVKSLAVAKTEIAKDTDKPRKYYS